MKERAGVLKPVRCTGCHGTKKRYVLRGGLNAEQVKVDCWDCGGTGTQYV